MAALTFIGLVVLIIWGTWHTTMAKHDVDTYFYEPVGPFVILLASAVFLLAKYTMIRFSHFFSGACKNAGKHTLGIYLCHALVLNFFDLNDINYGIFTPVLSIPLIAVACFLISWLFIYIISKVPLLKYIAG